MLLHSMEEFLGTRPHHTKEKNDNVTPLNVTFLCY